MPVRRNIIKVEGKTNMEAGKTGKYAWAAIGAFVAAYDLFSHDTLTASFKRGTESPRTRPLVYGALGVTALHLMGALPKQIDPFYLALELPGISRIEQNQV